MNHLLDDKHYRLQIKLSRDQQSQEVKSFQFSLSLLQLLPSWCCSFCFLSLMKWLTWDQETILLINLVLPRLKRIRNVPERLYNAERCYYTNVFRNIVSFMNQKLSIINCDIASFLKHNKSNLKVYQTCRNSRRKFFILHNWTVQCLTVVVIYGLVLVKNDQKHFTL